MKGTVPFFVVIFFVTLISSCGSSKKAVSESGKKLLADEPCQVYAMEKPAKRAAGTGTHFQESTARNLAELDARAQLARALQTCIETGTSSYAGKTDLFAADESSGKSVSDQSAKVNDRMSGLAKELIKGAVVAKMTRYKTTNNQYEVWVCLEYDEDAPKMAAKVAEAFNEKLTKEQKDRINFDEYLFKQEMEKALNNYQGVTTP